MEENTKYSDRNDNQGEMQDGCQKPDSYQNDYIEEVRFTEQTDGVEMPENSSSQEDACQSNGYPGHNDQSDQSNGNYNYNNNQNNYQNSYQNDSYQGNVYQSTGYPAETYQNDNEQNSAYQNNAWQSNGYQNNTGQNGYYQNDNEQNSAYQNNAWQSNGYQNNTYQNSAWQNGNFQNNTYMNGAYPNNTYSNYGGNYQQYNGAQPYDSQVELEEPVKVSEWVLAMVLMMIPCVNIIMMFVWAFSSTEKKSKSNFFKAYLIFFGISMGVMLLVWFAIVIFALAL